MSSIRNAVQRRVHRERAQPLERSKLGLLEKHKDYSLRAKDFNKKKAQLRALRAKAADRNEDEFYFGMMSRKGPGDRLSKGKSWTGTVDGDRGTGKVLDMDTVRLLKTQDVGYVRTVRTKVAKEVKGLEERVVGLGGGLEEVEAEDEDEDEDEEMGEAGLRPANKAQAKKIVFASDADERNEILRQKHSKEEDNDNDSSSSGNIQSAPDGVAPKNPKNSQKAPASTPQEELLHHAEQQAKLLAKLQRRLQNARKKLRVLARTEHQMELQRAKMGKRTTSMNGVTKAGKKFKVRERKR